MNKKEDTIKKDVVRFEGVDDWNRAIFKSVDSEKRYGDLTQCFSWNVTKEEVLEKVNVKNILFFGYSFGCEPYGCKANIEIRKGL